MFYPNMDTVRELARDGCRFIPISAEYYADMDTPISIFKRLETARFCFLLESVAGSEDMARYSFIGRNPFLVFSSKGNSITVTRYNGEKKTYTGDPMAELERLCKECRSPILPGIPQFSGGAVGCFGYDTVRLTEELPNPPAEDPGLPDLHFMFADELIAFDHVRQKLIIMVNMRTDGDLQTAYDRATQRIIDIRAELAERPLQRTLRSIPYREVSKPQSNMSKEDFCSMVDKAKEYIRQGDIFQVVLSQRFSVDYTGDPFAAYRAIRLLNPSPYMYYLKFDDYQVAGASPEMLVRVEGEHVQTSPIAGTRPRGSNPDEDRRLEQDLIEDPKENAEHTMLVDLGRNDLGRVSQFGTVKVSRLKYIQRFSHVMHMTSDVTGLLLPEKSPFDALRSVLPAGTLSGAPKVRAMEIIDELEPVGRGIYGGAVGYLGFNGNLDSCITIRTALFQKGAAYVQAGGGIVYDSVPEKEYQESVNKAAAMIRAIEKAGDLQ